MNSAHKKLLSCREGLKRIGVAWLLSSILALCSVAHAAETIIPDLKKAPDQNGWKIENAKVTFVTDAKGKPALQLKSGTAGDNGIVRLAGLEFTNGTIEFDCLGRSAPVQACFIGCAFRIDSAETYDAVYFRPFNFRTPDPDRKAHAVQYTSHPKFPWQVLRQQFPGKYEKPIDPSLDGDAWFHARIVVNKPKVSIYVNDAKEPSLVVDELSDRKGGGIGLWVGPYTEAHIANLKITPAN